MNHCQLTDQELSTKGNKSGLVHCLLEFHSLEKVRSSLERNSHQVNCKYGITCADERPMVECYICMKWSHQHCYNLSASVCVLMYWSPTLLILLLSWYVRAHLKDNLTRQIHSFNTQFLALREELNRSTTTVNCKIYQDIGSIQDNLKFLNQTVDCLPSVVSSSVPFTVEMPQWGKLLLVME